jgi:nucleotide-binding universal stress UspA family protein
MGTIVVGFDGSAQSLNALRWAVVEASYRGSQLRVVSVWDIPYDHVGDGETRPYDQVEGETRGALDVAIQTEVTDAAILSTVERVVVNGNPTKVLLLESETAEFLVVGSSGSGAIHSLIFGSTALELVKHAHCPVVVIPSQIPLRDMDPLKTP